MIIHKKDKGCVKEKIDIPETSKHKP